MFEREPFRSCPACGCDAALEGLSAGGRALTRRCKRCRRVVRETLPALNKAVIYLDQFAISNVYKVSTGKLRESANSRAFWIALHEAVQRAYLLQQAVFPASNIHTDETMVAATMADELSLAHEMLSGDTEFHSVDEIVMTQVWAFAEAYADGRSAPELDFDVDAILHGERNSWLPELHITANMSFAQFAPAVRTGRDTAARDLQALAAHWAREKPSFASVLKRELNSMASANRGAVLSSTRRMQRAIETQDMLEMVEASHSTIMRQFQHLKSFFEKRGTPPDQSTAEVVRFWDWAENRHQPAHRISSYLFAGLARRTANGQKAPDRGTLNDIRAISTYGPYVDAMFIDRMFDALLGERPLSTDLTMKAHVFSIRTGESFLAYLDGLASRAGADVRRHAEEVYGIT